MSTIFETRGFRDHIINYILDHTINDYEDEAFTYNKGLFEEKEKELDNKKDRTFFADGNVWVKLVRLNNIKTMIRLINDAEISNALKSSDICPKLKKVYFRHNRDYGLLRPLLENSFPYFQEKEKKNYETKDLELKKGSEKVFLYLSIITEKIDGTIFYLDQEEATLLNNPFDLFTTVDAWKNARDQLAEKIKVFHDRGFIHGDLIPRNVGFKRKDDSNNNIAIYLIDFDTSYFIGEGRVDLDEEYKKSLKYVKNPIFNKSVKEIEKKIRSNFSDVFKEGTKNVVYYYQDYETDPKNKGLVKRFEAIGLEINRIFDEYKSKNIPLYEESIVDKIPLLRKVDLAVLKFFDEPEEIKIERLKKEKSDKERIQEEKEKQEQAEKERILEEKEKQEQKELEGLFESFGTDGGLVLSKEEEEGSESTEIVESEGEEQQQQSFFEIPEKKGFPYDKYYDDNEDGKQPKRDLLDIVTLKKHSILKPPVIPGQAALPVLPSEKSMITFTYLYSELEEILDPEIIPGDELPVFDNKKSLAIDYQTNQLFNTSKRVYNNCTMADKTYLSILKLDTTQTLNETKNNNDRLLAFNKIVTGGKIQSTDLLNSIDGLYKTFEKFPDIVVNIFEKLSQRHISFYLKERKRLTSVFKEREGYYKKEYELWTVPLLRIINNNNQLYSITEYDIIDIETQFKRWIYFGTSDNGFPDYDNLSCFMDSTLVVLTLTSKVFRNAVITPPKPKGIIEEMNFEFLNEYFNFDPVNEDYVKLMDYSSNLVKNIISTNEQIRGIYTSKFCVSEIRRILSKTNVQIRMDKEGEMSEVFDELIKQLKLEAYFTSPIILDTKDISSSFPHPDLFEDVITTRQAILSTGFLVDSDTPLDFYSLTKTYFNRKKHVYLPDYFYMKNSHVIAQSTPAEKGLESEQETKKIFLTFNGNFDQDIIIDRIWGSSKVYKIVALSLNIIPSREELEQSLTSIERVTLKPVEKAAKLTGHYVNYIRIGKDWYFYDDHYILEPAKRWQDTKTMTKFVKLKSIKDYDESEIREGYTKEEQDMYDSLKDNNLKDSLKANQLSRNRHATNIEKYTEMIFLSTNY